MGSCEGKVAIVTGASRGIGAAIAARLAASGARVAAVARTLESDRPDIASLQCTVSSIIRDGGEAIAVQADLSRPDQRRRLAAEVEQRLGAVDILVNNAAVTFLAPVTEFTQKHFDLMFELQVRAPFELTQLVLPGLRARGAGWILNISSRAAMHPVGPPFEELHAQGGWAVYGLCKAALERFTTALAAESHAWGVRVNALAPWDNVATPGAAVHDLVEGFPHEDPSVIAEAAHALVSGDLTGRICYSQQLLDELGMTPQPLPASLG